MLLHELTIDDNNMGFIPSLGTSFQLNLTAKEIINLLKQGKSKDEVIEVLSNKDNAKWEEVYIDVDDFFKKLKVYGLL